MIYVEADNIISPLGETTKANCQAVMSGRSALHACSALCEGMDGAVLSLLTPEQRADMAIEDLTPFESMVVASARRALADIVFDVQSPRVILIVSTTKGAVEQLAAGAATASDIYLGASARRIASTLGVITEPVVVCNACISGLAAVILAMRLLDVGAYDHAIVCGADCQGRFIISGFQSLKALSQQPCRPFDMERTGLNLGEAAATLVLGKMETKQGQWRITRGAVRNDAYHNTTPARKADGLRLCLENVLEDVPVESLAMVNAHGTATLFNDQMESVALLQEGLSGVPVNALKGYYGHTMGAAGLLETILTMHALDENTIVGTRGLDELGVSGKISMSAESRPTDKTTFVKMLSGFGGCNAAILASRENVTTEAPRRNFEMKYIHKVTISPEGAMVDGIVVATEGKGLEMLTNIYKTLGCNYPKYYKMDALSRLGFLATELLLGAESSERQPRDDRAIIFFNRSSSIVSDRKYIESIKSPEGYFPSPSVFVYTLPNIVTGEVAIRNGYHGETSFYVLAERNDRLQDVITAASLSDTKMHSAIAGWLDFEDEDHFLADISIIEI